ncbi:MAG: T9SS type A sorting domain-containing protein [Balneolaceae bacterium]|nr:T9SS type A sorting domain-containing protein [Balneolaceae bacterium]
MNFRTNILKIRLIFPLLFCLGWIAIPQVQAQNTQWNGSVNSDWFESANWSNGVPNESTEARINFIPAGNSEPVITSDATVRALSIGSNSQTVSVGDNATLNVLENIVVGNSGTLDVGNGSLIVNSASRVDGTILLDNGMVQFLDDFDHRGTFTVQTGTVNIGDPGPPVVSANFELGGNSSFNLNNGTLNVYGASDVGGSGSISSDEGEINFFGESSFSGSGELNGGDGIIRFNDSASFTGSGTINAENSTVEVNNTDLFFRGNGQFEPGTSTVVITGNSSLSGGRNNYPISLYNLVVEDGAQLDIDRANVTVLNDATLIGDAEVSEVNGGSINIEGETVRPPANVFYSRQDGNWNDINSWARRSHDGPVFQNRLPGSREDDVVIIGEGHEITITSDVTLENIMTVDVLENSSLAVGTNGSLEMQPERIVTGGGTFTLSDGALLYIGSTEGITSAGESGNIQTDTRNFSTGGNYVYQGEESQVTGSGLPETVRNLEINNTDGVSLSDNLRIAELLLLTDGTFTIGDGLSLIQNSEQVVSGELRYLLEIGGNRGYRLLSAPIAANFSNFLSGTITQGIPGAQLSETLQPNILWYDETYPGTDNQRWRAPASMDENVTQGRGYHVYMFGDIEEDSRYNDPFPITIDVNGESFDVNSEEIDLNATFTAEADSGWNLVGNPYGASIDWNSSSWTRTNIDETIYIWDPNTNQYQTWNGVTGDITDGIIAPFQGFWIKANDENPELRVNRDARTFGGEFVGKATVAHPSISIEAYHSENRRSTAHFSFTEDAKYGLDSRDAHKLLPPPGVDNYLEIFSRTDKGDRLAINNLPRRFGRTIEIPFEINAWKDGKAVQDEVELRVKGFDHIPTWWDVQIINKQTGERVPVTRNERLMVDMGHVRSRSMGKGKDSGYSVVTRSGDSHAGFVLRIDPGEDAGDLPGDFEMKQNYPNPFNPTTTVRFNLPVQSDVRLDIYDMVGRRVATLVDGTMQAGTHEQIWDASRLASGVYIARLITPEQTYIRKLTLIK